MVEWRNVAIALKIPPARDSECNLFSTVAVAIFDTMAHANSESDK